MTVRKRSHDLPRPGLRQRLATQSTSNSLDQVRRQVREITEGLMLDLTVLAIGAAQQVGLINASLVDASRRGYVNSARSSCHAMKIADTCAFVKRHRAF